MKLWPLVVLVIACETRLDLGRDRAATTDDAGAPDDDDDSVPDASAASTASCADVCSRVIACGILDASDRAECLGRCSAGSTATDRACIMQSSCAVMVDACGIPTSDEPEDDAGIDTGEEAFQIQVCQDACDNAHFQDCLDGTQHAACRARCATAPSATRETFTSCIHTTTGDCSDSVACYDELAAGS